MKMLTEEPIPKILIEHIFYEKTCFLQKHVYGTMGCCWCWLTRVFRGSWFPCSLEKIPLFPGV